MGKHQRRWKRDGSRRRLSQETQRGSRAANSVAARGWRGKLEGKDEEGLCLFWRLARPGDPLLLLQRPLSRPCQWRCARVTGALHSRAQVSLRPRRLSARLHSRALPPLDCSQEPEVSGLATRCVQSETAPRAAKN